VSSFMSGVFRECWCIYNARKKCYRDDCNSL